MDNVFFDGDIFGIVDNGVLAVLSILVVQVSWLDYLVHFWVMH